MKITRIQVSNFIGARAVDLELRKPIAMISGKNGSGKSSIRDAIALAFTADLCRVSLKKEAAALISEGGESCFVEITTDADTYGVAITAAGKISDTMAGKETPAALPYVLDAQRFARMADNERRAFLFGLIGIKLDGPAIKERLLKRQCIAAKVEQIMPILRTGFEAASKEAASRARDAKASWKTTTGGETYGDKKAASWAATKPAFDAAALADLQQRLAAIDAGLADANQRMGALQADHKRHAEATQRLDDLREKGSRYARIANKLVRDEAELKEWEDRVVVLKGSALSQNALPCPDCGTMLVLKDGVLVHAAPLAKGTEDDLARLPEYEKALRLLQSSVANDKRDLAAADAAAKTIAELEAAVGSAPDEAEIHAARKHLDDLKAERSDIAAKLAGQQDAERQARQADERTAKALAAHESVLAWIAIADALSPDGIPGELLAEALDPINEHLRVSAADAEWEPAQINSDMTITYGLRDYALVSESEKWRADAMIAEAVSHFAGIKLLVLDRFDVLDLKGREDLLYWLDGMAGNGEIDTALIFGTLKSLPAQLLPSIDGFWLGSGVAGLAK